MEKQNEKVFEKIGMYGLLSFMTGFGMVVGIESQSKMFAWGLFAENKKKLHWRRMFSQRDLFPISKFKRQNRD